MDENPYQPPEEPNEWYWFYKRPILTDEQQILAAGVFNFIAAVSIILLVYWVVRWFFP